MPAPLGPAVAGPVLPPISNDAIVDSRGILTAIGLNLFQQIWAATFGSDSIITKLPKPGDMKPIAGAVASSGWLLCDGTAYQQSVYPDLFAAIGTTWGSGGAGTFRVPDLKGNFIIGADGTHALGATGGALNRTIGKTNLPSYALSVTDPGHTHVVIDPGHTHTIADPGHHHSGGFSATSTNTAGAAAGTGTSGNTGNATTGITVDSATTGITNDNATTGITVDSGGGGIPLDITPTFAAVNWLIKT